MVFDVATAQITPFLESNIEKFESDPPVYIMSSTIYQDNDKRFNLLTANVKELYINSQNYFDFTEVYLQKPDPQNADKQ